MTIHYETLVQRVEDATGGDHDAVALRCSQFLTTLDKGIRPKEETPLDHASLAHIIQPASCRA